MLAWKAWEFPHENHGILLWLHAPWFSRESMEFPHAFSMVFHGFPMLSVPGNKLKKVMKVAISLNELDNSDTLKDGRPSSILFTYYGTSLEYYTLFKPRNPQYKALQYGEIVSLTLKITDQNNNIITNGPVTTVVLHIQQLKCTSLLIT